MREQQKFDPHNQLEKKKQKYLEKLKQRSLENLGLSPKEAKKGTKDVNWKSKIRKRIAKRQSSKLSAHHSNPMFEPSDGRT